MTLARRHFLQSATAGWLSTGSILKAASTSPVEPRTSNETTAFFLISDTHVLAAEADRTQLDARSRTVCTQLIETLNRLPGAAIPEALGGGTVLQPRGVLHAGDCIDTGDKAKVQMQQTEWAGFEELFGLKGGDGLLRYPLYEVHGNHDSPRGDGHAVQQIIRRNRERPGVLQVSESGVHYAWDWGPVHFVNLGIVVGEVSQVSRRRRYAPLGSLPFLIRDLETHVGDSGRPIVLTHHIDLLRYSQALPVDDRQAMGMEWDPEDVRGYYDAIRNYNVAAVLYGHTHGRNVYRWDGSSKPAATGLPVFNVDNSSHFGGQQQAFFYFEITAERVRVLEYQTRDAWQTGFWTDRPIA
jgi:predicted phosphodiesterase